MKMNKKAKATALLLSIMMIFAMAPLLPMNAQTAYADDTNQPVEVSGDTEHHVQVNGDVTVEGSDHAVKAVADGSSELSGENDVSVKVNGSVELTGNEVSGTAVDAEGRTGRASVDVTGNVSVEGVKATGVSAQGNEEGTADVKIGGSVTSKGGSEVTEAGSATGIELVGGNGITVKDNVSAEGINSVGVKAETWMKSHVEVGRSVHAEGGNATGVILDAVSEGDVEGELTFTVRDSIEAISVPVGGYVSATGIQVRNHGGKIQADIARDVVAVEQNKNAVGIKISNEGIEDPGPYLGISNVLIHGDLVSDGVGIFSNTIGEPGKTDILIEKELKAKDVGVLLQKGWYISVDDGATEEGATEDNLNLTVWKADLNARGNVAERISPVGDLEPSEPTAATDFEKTIMYIIKLEQPGEGGTLSATDGNGDTLTKSFGFDVAHQGDKVLLKVDVQEGYELIAAYNGKLKVPLLKDENSNYYIVVPKGGGVYLSVELQKVERQVDPTKPDEKREKAKNTENAKDTEKTKGSEKAKDPENTKDPEDTKAKTSVNKTTKGSTVNNTTAAPAGVRAGLVLSGAAAEKGSLEDLLWENMQNYAKADPASTMTCLTSKDANEQKSNLEKLNTEGYDIIFCTGDMADLVKEEAKAHPNQHYVLFGGEDPGLDNVATVVFTDKGKTIKTPTERQVSLALNKMCDMQKTGAFAGGTYTYDIED